MNVVCAVVCEAACCMEVRPGLQGKNLKSQMLALRLLSLQAQPVIQCGRTSASRDENGQVDV